MCGQRTNYNKYSNVLCGAREQQVNNMIHYDFLLNVGKKAIRSRAAHLAIAIEIQTDDIRHKSKDISQTCYTYLAKSIKERAV